jgi:RimJ/RimL family protein N-acetyltransferase
MSFRFLDPLPLVDGELSLVVPQLWHLSLAMAAARHPLSIADRNQPRTTLRQMQEFIESVPGGHQDGEGADRVPAYHFFMWLDRPARESGRAGQPMPTWGEGDPPVTIAGGIGLRIGNTPDIERYIGHIGYNVYSPVRGNHYAERAVRLLLPLAARHGLATLWITCNPDNAASRRTCERLGCELVEIVDLPEDHLLRQRGETQKCRYRLSV